MTSPLPQAPVRPPGITAVIVIAIVLSGWEAMNTLGGLGAMSAFRRIQEIVPTDQIRPQEREQLARDQKLMAAMVRPGEFLIWAGLTVPIAIWTIVAAIRLNQGKRGSASGFVRAVTALALVEVVQVVFAIRMSTAAHPFAEDFLRALGANLPVDVDSAKTLRTLQNFFRLAAIGGAIVGFAVAAGKIVACLYARRRAGAPDVVAWTSGPGPTTTG
jgi:hypothetical protein